MITKMSLILGTVFTLIIVGCGQIDSESPKIQKSGNLNTNQKDEVKYYVSPDPGTDYDLNIYDPKDEKKIFEYVSAILSVEQTSQSYGPVNVSADNGIDSGPIINCKGNYTYSKIVEVKNRDKQKKILEEVYGIHHTDHDDRHDTDNTLAFTDHYYFCGSDCGMINSLGSIKAVRDTQTQTVTLGGNLLRITHDSQSPPLIMVYLGSKNVGTRDNNDDTGNIVIDHNNVAQKGVIIIYCNGKEKEYDIQNLSLSQKAALNKLNIFTLK